MLHFALVILFALPIVILAMVGCICLLLAWCLGGGYPDGGLAGIFKGIGDALYVACDAMWTTLTKRKPVALTFNGAVRFWRKNLAIARDIDSKNWEVVADIKRYSIKKLPIWFDYSSKTNNSFHKQYRFACYVISKRKSAA